MMNNKFLRSRVARRVFLLFIACALVPIAAFTVLGFFEASSELRTQRDRELQQSAKSLALEIFQRLSMLDADLQVAVLSKQSPSAAQTTSTPAHFNRIFEWDEEGAEHEGAPLSAEELAHLHSGQSVVRIARCANDPGSECVVMIKALEADDHGTRLMAGEVSGAYLWNAEQLPADTAMLVRSGDHDPLFTSDLGLPSALDRFTQHASSGVMNWTDRTSADEFARRDLYLKAQFMAPSWTVIVRRTDRTHISALQRFRNTLLLVTSLAIWIVILFSSIQIRRTMVPLDELKDATSNIAEQNFGRRVHVTSGDEFQELGASFNAMAGRLGRQFHVLRAISNIDQSVLVSMNLDSVIETTLASVSQLLPCDCYGIATFEFESSGVCFAKLHLRERSSEALFTFTNRIVSAPMLAELQASRSLEVPLESAPLPELLLPLAERAMRVAEVFPILRDGKLFAALVCAHASPQRMPEDDRESAREVADRLTVGLSNMSLIDALEQMNWGTLTALARAVDAKSGWTAGHSERVTHMALRIARAMGLPHNDLQTMQRGGLLHDIGKIGTPLEILDKPSKLTDQEMAIMREHVQTGVRILEPVAAFADALPIVAQHHEWFNGNGYPAGLAGEEISLHARIFAVADCYDALISDRPYRSGLPLNRVIQMLAANSGKQFDPKVIEIFLSLQPLATLQADSEDIPCLTEQKS